MSNDLIQEASALIAESFPIKEISEEIRDALETLKISWKDSEDTELNVKLINQLISKRFMENHYGSTVIVLLSKILLVEKARQKFGSDSDELQAAYDAVSSDETTPDAVKIALVFWNALMEYNDPEIEVVS